MATDPLIKSLKYLIEELHSEKDVITDEHVYLATFCQTLEHSLTQGIRIGKYSFQENGQSFRRKKFWELLDGFQTNGPVPYQISALVRLAKSKLSLKNGDGRLRYLIRSCLTKSLIHVLLEFLMSRVRDLHQWYDESDELDRTCIITSEHLAEQLKSLLLVVSTSLEFDLEIDNYYFLDETWLIPKLTQEEFVPTLELGIGLIYMEGCCIITNVKPGSVVADSNKIGVGDVLVELNENLLYPAKNNGSNNVQNIWQQCRQNTQPCNLKVVKARCPSTRSVFRPLKNAITQYQDYMKDFNNKKQQELDNIIKKQELKKAKQLSPKSWDWGMAPVMSSEQEMESYRCKYVGEVVVGECGGMGRIEGVIRHAITKQNQLTTLNVVLNINQISVIVKSRCERAAHAEQSTSEQNGALSTLFTHKFSDISSCGKISSHENHFCYIAGDTFCTISTQFKGYVFEAKSQSQAKLILNNIFQGFKRTTWCM